MREHTTRITVEILPNIQEFQRFRQIDPGEIFNYSQYNKRIENTLDADLSPFTDQQCLISVSIVKCFLLDKKEWDKMDLHEFHDITWSKNAFKPFFWAAMRKICSKPSSMENCLETTLKLCGQWNAVLLIVEADIFMEARSADNLGRKELFSSLAQLHPEIRSKDVDFSEEALEQLAKCNFNGRQINSAIKIARMSAAMEQKPLN
ncbi:hypothetical protein K469DRAFT_690918 [Zopfia rhizophila CBS 207.26]|uniref:Uncharacterized protein n=1 Tax=Zopfia rhizophila CBS 207.26 TaxID=1314779 RepID=A0A6A6DWW6_9PEZI|nr:hypothetical protein K469DRAFT_690918 [Zopfia rhizophila CBS 207.26]